MVKELQSTGETKAKIEFATEVSKDYKLDIKSIEVKKELADKNVKFVADINVLDGNNNVVKISNIKMKIRIALPENLKRYDKYEIVYISNGEIKETIPAAVENGYIVFETNHLSQYGIIATNTGNGTKSRRFRPQAPALRLHVPSFGRLPVPFRFPPILTEYAVMITLFSY